jgi:hypothetical protein
MATLTRDEALRVLEERHAANAALFGRLSDDQMTAAGTIGGGTWSAKDLLGHIAAWERYAFETLGSIRRGEVPAIETVAGDQDAVNRLNDEAIARDANLPLQHVRESSESAFRDLVGVIRSMTDAEWNAAYDTGDTGDTEDPGGAPETVGEVLGGITSAPPPDGSFAHVSAHIEALRSYVESVAETRD